MTERKMLSQFIKQLKAMSSESFIHKDADTYGGARKPFDWYAVHKGVLFAVEAKKENAHLKPHQEDGLHGASIAGGISYVMRFNGRDAVFHPYYEDRERFDVSVIYRYSKGHYVGLEFLFPNLLRRWGDAKYFNTSFL